MTAKLAVEARTFTVYRPVTGSPKLSNGAVRFPRSLGELGTPACEPSQKPNDCAAVSVAGCFRPGLSNASLFDDGRNPSVSKRSSVGERERWKPPLRLHFPQHLAHGSRVARKRDHADARG